MRIFCIILLIFTSLLSSSQKLEGSYKYGTGLDNRHFKTIQNFKGNLLSVGTTESYYSEFVQLLLVETDINGKNIFVKEIGDFKHANNVIDMIEDNHSRIIILGNTVLQNSKKKNWISVRDFKGEFVKEIELEKNIQPLQLISKGENIDLFAIRKNKLIWIQYNSDLSSELFRKTIESKENFSIEEAKIYVGPNEYVMFASARKSKKNRFMYLANFDANGILEDVKLVEDNFHSIGQLKVESNIGYYFTYHSFSNRNQEDVNFCWIDQSLNKSKSYKRKEFKFLGADLNQTINYTKDKIYLHNNSTSHIRGGSTSKIQIIELDKEFSQIGEENYLKLNNFSEYADNILWVNKNAYLFGTLNDGSSFSSDLNFCRAKTQIPFKEARSQEFEKDQLTIDYEFQSEEFNGVLYSGLDQKVSITITNNSDIDLTDVVFESIDGINKTFSIKALEKKEFTFPIVSKKEPFEWNYRITKNDAPLEEYSEKIKPLILKAGKLEIHSIELLHDRDFLYKGESLKLKVIVKKSGLRDKDRVDLLAVGNEIKDIEPNDWNVKDLNNETSQYTFNVTSLSQTNGQVLEIRFNGFVNDVVADNQNITMPLRTRELNVKSLAAISLDSIVGKRQDKIHLQVDKVNTGEEKSQDSQITLALFSNPEEVVYKKVIDLQYVVVSNVDLQEENFFYRLNGEDRYLVKGAKADEIKLSALKNSQKTKKINLNILLREGVNEIVLGYDDNGKKFVSDVVVTNFQNRQKGNLHLYSIGISDKHWKDRLQFTQQDAQSFKALIEKQEGKFFNRVYSNLLIEDNQTTKTKILSSLNELTRKKNSGLIREQDVIVFFISTHGINTSDGKQFLTCSDYTSGMEDLSALDFVKDIYDPFENFPCKKMYFIDACHSGAINEELLGRKGISDDNIAYKGALQKLIETENLSNVMLSCGPTEYSYEHKNWGNSAFIESLEIILADKALCSSLDKNEDNLLSLSEIEFEFKRITNDLVQKEFGKKTNQIPILTGEKGFKELPFLAY